MPNGQEIQVSVEHVLRATQGRLQQALEQSIMLEALLNQQGEELNQLRERVDQIGRELTDGQEPEES